MDNYTIFKMFENPRRCRQARTFTTSVPKIKDLKLSSVQIILPKLTLGAPESSPDSYSVQTNQENMIFMAKKKLHTCSYSGPGISEKNKYRRFRQAILRTLNLRPEGVRSNGSRLYLAI